MHKAILMAAGLGTRISREIENNCKCILDIGEEPLIRHTANMLLDKGIEVHVVVGFQKQRVKDALQGLPVTFYENPFYTITNSMASLWFAQEALVGDSIILGNADVFWEENLLSILLEETRDCVMLSDSSRVEQGDYLFSVEDGKVRSYGKGMNCQNANCEYVGLARLQRDLIPRFRQDLNRLIDAQCHTAWWEQVLYNMIPNEPIWARDVKGCFWAEIDYVEDYRRILEYRREQGFQV